MTNDPDIERLIGELPTYTVGLEHEYKWLLIAQDVPDDVASALASMGLTGDYPIRSASDVTHSSVYFDDEEWSLAGDGLSLTLRVYHGSMRSFGALIVKHTLEWAGGRRDAAELGARVDPSRISEELDEWKLLPLRHLTRHFRRPLRLAPYATAVQIRKQAHLGSAASGTPMVFSLDRMSIHRPGDPVPLSTQVWMEIECNEPGRRTLRDLGDLAGKITASLGQAPHSLTKPEFAARLLGWGDGDDR